MTWAEVLAVFNFIAWLLPIIIRTWMAWRYDNTNTVVLSTEESGVISRAVKGLKLGNKRLKIGHDSEGIGHDKEGCK